MRRSAGRMPTLPETRLPRTRSTHAGNFPRSFPDDGFSWRAERRHPPPKDGSLLYLCTGFNHTLTANSSSCFQFDAIGLVLRGDAAACFGKARGITGDRAFSPILSNEELP
jgi:hypothetical protein